MYEEKILLMQETYDREIATNIPNSKITMGISAEMMCICDLLEKKNYYSQIEKLRLLSPLFNDLVTIANSILLHRK